MKVLFPASPVPVSVGVRVCGCEGEVCVCEEEVCVCVCGGGECERHCIIMHVVAI